MSEASRKSKVEGSKRKAHIRVLRCGCIQVYVRVARAWTLLSPCATRYERDKRRGRRECAE
jgi:hypothetical protein